MNNLNLVTVESRILGPKKFRKVLEDLSSYDEERSGNFLSKSFAEATDSADLYDRPSSWSVFLMEVCRLMRLI